MSSPSPRRTGFAHRHGLVEILVITACALFSEVEGFEDVVRWAHVKEAWLRRFLLLKNGIPSADTSSRVFHLLDPKTFESAFRSWAGSTLTAFNHVPIAGFEPTERARGRTVLHHVQVIASTGQIDNAVWPDCQRLGRVVSLRVDGKNRLHWSLDAIFHEDASTIRKDHGPRNIRLIRKIILTKT